MSGGHETTIELEAKEVWFFSPNDEAAFFEWVRKIPGVIGSEGRGRSIFLIVDNANVEESDLRELIALFRRYKISMKQLAVFDRDRFSKWFSGKDTGWYEDVFE